MAGKIKIAKRYVNKMEEQEQIKKSKKVIFRYLISPDLKYFGITDLEQLFEIFKWMATTGKGYKGMKEALSGQPTCLNFFEIKPFKFNPIKELLFRFSVILNSSFIKLNVWEWKKKYKVDLNTERKIPIRYKKKHWIDRMTCKDNYTKIFEEVLNKRKFKVPLNEIHPDCVLINQVEFFITDTTYFKKKADYRYQFKFYYSNNLERFYTWNRDIVSEKEELFSDFCIRAYDTLINETEMII